MAEERRRNFFDDINSGISDITNGLKTVKFGTALSSSFWGWIILGTIFSIGFITFTMDMGNEGAASEGNQAQIQQPQSQPVQSNDISLWGNKIMSALKQFPQACPDTGLNVWNILTDQITNGSYTTHYRTGSLCGGSDQPSTYYCTDLVIDTYNLAGIKNNFSEGSGAMFDSWSSIPGLTVRKENDVRGLKPGDAVFWFDNNGVGQHVGLISAIDVYSGTGNGTLTTIDANMNDKSTRWEVKDFELLGDKWRKGTIRTPLFGLGPR